MITLVLLSFFSVSCSNVTSSDDVTVAENKTKPVVLEKTKATPLPTAKVEQAIALAKQNKDYRFLATSGRSTTLPGIDVSRFQTLIELCGKKYSSAAGDVITSEEQRGQRKKLVNFMRQYNEQMLVICRESQEK